MSRIQVAISIGHPKPLDLLANDNLTHSQTDWPGQLCKTGSRKMSMFYKAKQMLVQFLSLIHILDKNKLFFFICIQLLTREDNFFGGPPYNLHMFSNLKVTLVNVTQEKKVHASTRN